MKKKQILIMFLTLSSLLVGIVGLASAQSDARGEIHGVIYEDVNGDGICEGVEGDNPVPNITLEFVSSDEATVVELYTGSDGSYGLVAAGQSIWRVTAKPDPTEWTVTSENPLYPPVLPETGLVQTGVNFCITKGAAATVDGGGNAVIILPESGAAASTNGMMLISLLSLLGAALVAVGIGLEVRRRLHG